MKIFLPADDEEYAGGHALKRKKTVTWADGDEPVEGSGGEEREAEGTRPPSNGEDETMGDGFGENGGAGTAAAEPGALSIPANRGDPLFAGLDVSVLQEQEPFPCTSDEGLTRAQIIERRLALIDDLSGIYEAELWATADEILLRRWDLSLRSPGSSHGPSTGSKFKGIANDPSVAAAVSTGGVRAAWAVFSASSNGGAQAPLPSPSDLEDFVFCLPLEDTAGMEALKARVVNARQTYLASMESLSRLESAASASTSRDLDAHGAVAALCGRSTRYLLRRTAVMLGRASAAGQGAVDVDLSPEGADAVRAISRQQAQLFLDADGSFKVRCLGRREMSVNGQAVAQGQVAELPHLSLLRVGPVTLMFVVNMGALERLQRRSAAMTVY